ncbi:MAG: hypothetical protein N2327_08255 [Caldimicrobium sp.]|nr:hypothetical protein [Caldimicrobium sp.]
MALKFLKKFKNFSLKYQTLSIFVFTISFVSIIYLIFFLTINNRFINRLILDELNLIREIINPAIAPHIISERYDLVEHYLINILKSPHIEKIKLIDNKGNVLLSIVRYDEKFKRIYTQETIANLMETVKDYGKSIEILFPIKVEYTNENLSWINIVYSKEKYIKCQKEKILLFSGLILVTI